MNEATVVDEVVGFNRFMKKLDAEVMEQLTSTKPSEMISPMDQRISQMNLHNKIDYLQNMNQMPTTQPSKIQHQEKQTPVEFCISDLYNE